MNADLYQEMAARTLIDKPDFELTPDEVMLVWNGLGLAGEAGEAADEIKKAIFHRHGINREKIIKELGDVMWYVAAICTKMDIQLDEVMNTNINKLKERYPNGYTSADSLRAHKEKYA